MQPIFKEHIRMLKDNGVDIPIVEGFYWYDKSIIRAFDTEGNEYKLYRINIADDLTITYKKYPIPKKQTQYTIESWMQTAERLKSQIDRQERYSLRILKRLYKSDRKIIDTSSTGKDSVVKTYLAQISNLEFKTYFNVSTCDVSDTNLLAKELQFIHIKPNFKYKGVYPWMEAENIIPSRMNRACCTYFKEEPTIKYFEDKDRLLFLFGMRNSESANRSAYGWKWVNEKWGTNRDWIAILPVVKWSDLEIWLYIFRNNLPINEKYKKGYSRVGCGIMCPNYGKSTWVLDKYWYPILYNRWQKKLEADFLKNTKWTSVNCTLKEYKQGAWAGGLFRPEPSREVIQEFADSKGLDYEIAERYFDKYCMNGCKNIRQKPMKLKNADTIAMNLKLLGRNIDKFMCKKCLMKELNITKEQWNECIIDFKRQGCKLF